MRPIYAVDSSTTKTYERIASVSERKISKRIHGSVMDGNQRRIRTNSEVYDLYKDLDIIRIVKIFQLVAQVYRLKDHLDLKTQIDGITREARSLGVSNWTIVIKCRNQYRRLPRDIEPMIL